MGVLRRFRIRVPRERSLREWREELNCRRKSLRRIGAPKTYIIQLCIVIFVCILVIGRRFVKANQQVKLVSL